MSVVCTASVGTARNVVEVQKSLGYVADREAEPRAHDVERFPASWRKLFHKLGIFSRLSNMVGACGRPRVGISVYSR